MNDEKPESKIDNLHVGFEKAARPLIKWLNEYGNPHKTIIVDQTSAELLDGTLMFKTEDYLKD